ncbi:MAG: hypothetical protein M3P39_09225 [Actinomycetota bacterium]|jgi:hypothetical protein|nr:hypothetical protein [Actinomycetota bacterium]
MWLYEVGGAAEAGEGQAREAEALAADLQALVQAGLVAPVTDPAGAVRYAAVEPELGDAA